MIGGRYHGLIVCGATAYGNLDKKTVREAMLMEKTKATHYVFKSDGKIEETLSQIYRNI